MNYNIKDLELLEQLELLGKTDDEFVQEYAKQAEEVHTAIKQYESMDESEREQVKHLLAHQLVEFYPSLVETVTILAELSIGTINYLTYLSELLHATQSTKGAVKVEDHIKALVRVVEPLGYDVEDIVTQAHLAAQVVVKGGGKKWVDD